MLQTEVCTIFDYEGDSKKIHHVILTPSLETADQINERLKKYGDLSSDGRPILDCTAPQLVEEVMAVSEDNMVFPAHAWTPWFSLFGAFSGFDTVEDCYQDMTKHIHALETGLSSDPAMNWRLSKLDRYALLSNSDCHSFWPWRIGREANVFDLPDFTYKDVTSAIIDNDPERFKFTIETDPAYGKYHWTGHRNCKISLAPSEAIKFGNNCPVCRRKLTKGVEQRVEELADRPADYKRADVPGFMRSAAAFRNHRQPSWVQIRLLLKQSGNPTTNLSSSLATNTASSSMPHWMRWLLLLTQPLPRQSCSVRDGTAKVTPGYDGVYGQLVLGIEPLKVKDEGGCGCKGAAEEHERLLVTKPQLPFISVSFNIHKKP